MTTDIAPALDEVATAQVRVPQTNERLLDLLKRERAETVLDLGCGHGALSGLLADNGYRVTGIDPDWTAVATARDKVPAARFEAATAENLPFADDSFDAATFVNSLHHVPVPVMTKALDEALRVLRPGGALVIVEPLARGTFFEVMRPVEDETAIRGEAIKALEARIARGDCLLRERVVYDRHSTFAALEGFIDYLVAVDPSRRAVAEARRETLCELFMRHGVETPEGRAFVQPLMLVHLEAPARA
ncbi:class I SAM-dependent methyltransferase [Stappia sp.]|jgi:SAM-dependent methyltransferase|uniref:class I SAM-dependent methyltransferase n=1 Tax=Stappia sp. TaxID=1870903 RepID=UPI003A992757